MEPGLREALAALERPLAWMDFETIMPAIPVWSGCCPYDSVAVQVSVHAETEDGGVEHVAWLAEGPGDPREPLAERLLAATAGARTVLAWNAGFERRFVRAMAEVLPGHREALEDLASRVVDLLPIVRNHVYHPDFRGSFSLKAVLPALVPELGYGDLEIADGSTAAAVLETLLLDEAALSPDERAALRDRLLRYCERDTWALVRLTEVLRELAVPC